MKVSHLPERDPLAGQHGTVEAPTGSGSMTVAQREARKIAKSKEGGPEKDLSELAVHPHPAAEDTASLRRRVRLDAACKVAVNAALARQKDGPPAGSSE